MRLLPYIFAFLSAPAFLEAQTISGSWYGRAEVELTGLHNNYLTELVIKQKGTRVEGIFGYYFRDKYQSFFVHGTYNQKTREITILNLPVMYYGTNSTVNSIDCMTNFRGILITSRVGSMLKGTFYHDGRYKYLCPDLKVSYTLDKEDKSQDSAMTLAARARVWKPQKDDYVVEEVKAAPPVAAAGTVGTAADTMATGTRADTMAAVVKKESVAAVVSRKDSTNTDSVKIAESFAKRKTVLNRELLVESDSVRLSFYDNGEIDGDSISVFVNHELVVSHQGLEARAFNVYLHLDPTRELTEVSMFAENLGKLPPNTALMVVTDGKNRYEVFLASSLSENATVELRRKRP